MAETESVPQVFADDSMILAHDIDTAKKACHLTGEFAKITKQELAMSKTMAWATTTRDRAALRRIRFDGHTLNVMLDVTSLGARLCTSHAIESCRISPKEFTKPFESLIIFHRYLCLAQNEGRFAPLKFCLKCFSPVKSQPQVWPTWVNYEVPLHVQFGESVLLAPLKSY